MACWLRGNLWSRFKISSVALNGGSFKGIEASPTTSCLGLGVGLRNFSTDPKSEDHTTPSLPKPTYPDFEKTHIQRHPDADSLYVCTVQVSPVESRTLVTGLVPYYSEQQLRDRLIVTILNLKPTKLRGIVSQAMLLAATNLESKVPVLLEAVGESCVGDRIFLQKNIPGSLPEPAKQINSKSWEKIVSALSVRVRMIENYLSKQSNIKPSIGGDAFFLDERLVSEKGRITAPGCADNSPIH